MRLLLITVCSLVLLGCHKSHTPGVTTSTTTSTLPHFVDSISVYNCLLRNEYITFRASMPDEFLHAVETMVWNFGDGSAPLTIVQAAHIYTAAGTYDVSVTVNDIETVTRTIKIDTIPMSPLMEPMERKRRWVGWAKGTALEYGGKYFAVDSAIDSSFSMSINVNASSVYFFYGRFLLSTVTASTLTFRQCDYPGKTLVYYHENDSMVYTNIWSEPNRSGSFVIHTVK